VKACEWVDGHRCSMATPRAAKTALIAAGDGDESKVDGHRCSMATLNSANNHPMPPSDDGS